MHRRLLLVGVLALSVSGAAATWPDLAIPMPAWAGLAYAERWARGVAPDKPLPVGVKRYTAPPEYALWWKRLEECAGLRGDLERLRWHTARLVADTSGCRDCIDGYWDGHRDSSNIYIVRQYASPSRSVVEHEMLHELLYQNGVTNRDGRIPGTKRGHPRPPFGRCVAY